MVWRLRFTVALSRLPTASLLLALAFADRAQAALVLVTIDVPALFKSAQVVVLGDVIRTIIISTEQLPEPKGAFATVERVELSVVRCYKPLNECGASVAYSRRATVVEPQPALHTGEEVIAFLQGPEPLLTRPNHWSVWQVDWMKSTLEAGHTATYGASDASANPGSAYIGTRPKRCV